MSMLPVVLKAMPLNVPLPRAVSELVFVPFGLVIIQPFRVPLIDLNIGRFERR
jgi:hypothetical protein